MSDLFFQVTGERAEFVEKGPARAGRSAAVESPEEDQVDVDIEAADNVADKIAASHDIELTSTLGGDNRSEYGNVDAAGKPMEEEHASAETVAEATESSVDAEATESSVDAEATESSVDAEESAVEAEASAVDEEASLDDASSDDAEAASDETVVSSDEEATK
jgi:hypothetical protein